MTNYRAKKLIFLNSESKWPKWPWSPRTMTSILNTSLEYSMVHVWCKFGDSCRNLWRLIARKKQLPGILSKKAKTTLKVKVNDLHFQHQLRVSHDACLVQIWWFQVKFVTSDRADKVKFTDRQTDGRTERGRQRQHPFGQKGQGVETETGI